MKAAAVAVAAVGLILVGLGWLRYRNGIRHPSGLATYAKADGLSYLKNRRTRPVY